MGPLTEVGIEEEAAAFLMGIHEVYLWDYLRAEFRRQVCNSGEARRFNDKQQQTQAHHFSRSLQSCEEGRHSSSNHTDTF